MSYCVNCGVELGKSEKKCPLCNVPVINPKEPFDDKALRPYPKNTDTIKTIIDRKIFVLSLGILLLIPIAICLLTDFLGDYNLSWSIIATGGIILWWVFVCTPFIYRKNVIISSVTTDFFALCAFLYLIEFIYKDTWFWSVGIPIASTLYIIIILIAYGIKFSLIRGLNIASAVLIAIAILCFLIEIVLWVYYGSNEKSSFWSLYVIIPAVIISILFMIIERKKKLKKELSKRFHV